MKNIVFTERCNEAVHLRQKTATVCVRTLAAALCLTQAVLTISCDRSLTDPVHIRGESFIQRIDPYFSGYIIASTGTGVKVQWVTDTMMSSNYRWRETGGGWHTYLLGTDIFSLTHLANADDAFVIGVVYEFQAFGYDADGVLYEGTVLHFRRYAPPAETYSFDETIF